MKKILLLLLCTTTVFAQGKLAADYKKLIGQKYTDENGIIDLKTFRNEQGVVVGKLAADRRFLSTINVYKKGNTAIVLLSKMIHPALNEYRIIDMLKVVSIPKNYEIRISDCSRKLAYPDETIVAVVFLGTTRKVKIIKEAFALKDICFEKIATKGIQCINEGID